MHESLPALVVSIRKVLVGRGIAFETAEDIAQETAARALQYAADLDDARSLERWCFAVAWNLARDDWRRQQRFTSEPVPDRASAADVQRVVQFRLAEQEMLDAAALLPADLRASFVHTVRRLDEPLADGPRDRRRRFDLRRRLLASIENYPVVAALRVRQWLGDRAGAGLRWAGLLAVPVVAPVAASLFAAVEYSSLDDAAVVATTPGDVALIAASAPGAGSPVSVRLGAATPGRGRHAVGGRAGAAAGAPSEELTLVRYPNPGGGTGSLSLTPNPPDKPLVCAGVGSVEVCVDKPAIHEREQP